MHKRLAVTNVWTSLWRHATFLRTA